MVNSKASFSPCEQIQCKISLDTLVVIRVSLLLSRQSCHVWNAESPKLELHTFRQRATLLVLLLSLRLQNNPVSRISYEYNKCYDFGSDIKFWIVDVLNQIKLISLSPRKEKKKKLEKIVNLGFNFFWFHGGGEIPTSTGNCINAIEKKMNGWIK